MYPVIAAEMISGVVQLVVYFVTFIGVLVSFMLTARA